MGFRFRRSLKIIPGVRLNLGKRGVSVSVGVRGAHTTVGRQGVRTTVGLPGSGLSYTHLDKWGAPRRGGATASISAPPRTPPRPATLGQQLALVAGLAGLAVLAGIFGHWVVGALMLALAAFLGWEPWSLWRTRKARLAAPLGAPAATLTSAPTLPPATLPAYLPSVAPVRASVDVEPSNVAPDPEAAAYVTCARALRYAHLCESPDAVRTLLAARVGAPLSELSAALALHDHTAVVTLLNRATAKLGRG